MDEIKWLEVAVNTTSDKLDEVTAKLVAAGMDGLVIEDEGEFLQFLEQNRQYWDYVDQSLLDRMKGVTRVKFYVTDDEHGRQQLERYTHGLGWEYTVTQLAEKEGVHEGLKAQDQMVWVRAMNNIRNRAEEIVLNELIYGEVSV